MTSVATLSPTTPKEVLPETEIAAQMSETSPDNESEASLPACDASTVTTSPEAKPAKKGRKKDDKDKKQRPESVATQLVRMATELKVTLFHTLEKKAFVVIPQHGHRETWSLRSSSFRSWLKANYFRAAKKAAGAQAIEDAIGTLEGFALHASRMEPIYVRVAGFNDKMYLDLADKDWWAVEIDQDGWRLSEEPPVGFRRSRGLLPLPLPDRSGNINEPRPFINVASDDDWRLAVVWLLAALRPQGPYPLLVLSGQQGSAKSTTARILRSLVDPSCAPIRCEPKECRDLMIAANGSWILALDNLSHVPAWLSDALCRLSTGGGFTTRQLYTDDEEIIFDAQRPVILTSIEDVTTRGDLLERSLILSLPPIPEENRRSEKKLWQEFDAAYPRILGALLDATSRALRELPAVHLDRMPRMADFAEWAVACERALDWPPGSFVHAYDVNRAGANDVALESSPLINPIRELLVHPPDGTLIPGAWTGTAGELLEALAKLVGEQITRGRDWLKNGQALAGRLRRLAPHLAAVGIQINFERSDGKARKRVITISMPVEKIREIASDASAPSAYVASSDKSTVYGNWHTDASDATNTSADAIRSECVRNQPAEIPGESLLTDGADASDAFSSTHSCDTDSASDWPDLSEDFQTPFDSDTKAA